MSKALWLMSAGLFALAAPARAQDTPEAGAQPTSSTAEAGAVEPSDGGDIIVTATRRNQALSDVPVAVSAVTSEQLVNSGASDIRQLNQLSPSLLVSSTSSEAGAGVARIRGIGTVGDNPGLESSVAVFIDGVYRSRTGVGLTELGDIDRIEVLRGPQGTLFGRNASAGLVNIITKKPDFDFGGSASLTYGNYDYIRADGSLTGPIAKSIAARIDGVFMQRDGFLKDAISGRRINDRDRYLVRGQLLFEPEETDLSIRLIGDYTNRDEECCGGIYAPLVNYVRDPATPQGELGGVSLVPAPFAAVLRSLRDPAGNPVLINDTLGRRETAITPGRSYQSDVEDWGVSGEIVYDFGAATLTSITAYRDFQLKRSQDADFNNYDILYRDRERRGFETFTQELRLQGEAFGGRLDWLVGGYYADETLKLSDNLKFGTQFGNFANITFAAGLATNPLTAPAVPAFQATGFANLPAFVGALLPAGTPAPTRAAIVGAVAPVVLDNVGISRDDYRQKSRNWALFTHNIFRVTDRLSLTLGLRYTNERKTLDATLLSNNIGCRSIQQSIANLAALGAATAGIRTILTSAAALPCVANLNTLVDGRYNSRKSEDEFSGTAVLSFKPIPDLLTYASYSKGYKAGGFNLDRSALVASAPSAEQLKFEPETVNAFEIGAKFNGRQFDLNVAAFYQVFDQFQLNTFNGVNFLVENIQSCSDALGAAPAGSIYGGCAADKVEGGVTSQGVEVEAFLYPAPDLQFTTGVTLVDTRYRDRLVGLGGRPLVNELFLLPGNRLSNSAAAAVTGSMNYNPEIGGNGVRALLYADFRYQSEINSGSDLDIEKVQQGVMVVNARVGLQGPERRWGIELWAQNLFDVDYSQVYFDAPFQPLGGPAGGRVTALARGATQAVDRSTALFGRFLAEPRTYGITLRTRF